MWPLVSGFSHGAPCFQVHPHGGVCQCLCPSHGCITDQWVDAPHCVYLVIHSGTFPVFLPPGCWEQCHDDHPCTSTCLSDAFCFFQDRRRSGIAGSCSHSVSLFEDLPNRFPQRLHHSTFPAAVYAGSSFSTSLSTLVLFHCFL